MPMVTVSISPSQAAGIRTAVDTGRYASSSEVVREALRLWDATRKQSDLDNPEAADDAVHDGEGSAPRSVADMFSDYEAHVRRRA